MVRRVIERRVVDLRLEHLPPRAPARRCRARLSSRASHEAAHGAPPQPAARLRGCAAARGGGAEHLLARGVERDGDAWKRHGPQHQRAREREHRARRRVHEPEEVGHLQRSRMRR